VYDYGAEKAVGSSSGWSAYEAGKAVGRLGSHSSSGARSSYGEENVGSNGDPWKGYNILEYDIESGTGDSSSGSSTSSMIEAQTEVGMKSALASKMQKRRKEIKTGASSYLVRKDVVTKETNRETESASATTTILRHSSYIVHPLAGIGALSLIYLAWSQIIECKKYHCKAIDYEAVAEEV